MRCYICKKDFYDKDKTGMPNEYVSLFTSEKGRHYAHLFCFMTNADNKS